jgi:hypothetical protein
MSSTARIFVSSVRIPLKAWTSVLVYTVFVLGIGLATGRSPVQGVLPTLWYLETEVKRCVSRLPYAPSESNRNRRRRRRRRGRKRRLHVIFLNSNIGGGGGFHTGSTPQVGHFWSIVPAPGDCDGEFGGMKIGRGNRSPQRKPAPPPLCPLQIPPDQTRARTRAAAVGS